MSRGLRLGRKPQKLTIIATAAVTALLFVTVILDAVVVMRRGEMTYRNAYELTVVAPGAIVIGVFALVLLAVVTWRTLRAP